MHKSGIVMALMSLLLCSTAYAWGIAYANDQFTMLPGEEKYINFTLQNYVGDDVQRIILQVTGDDEIVTLLDPQDYYLLPPKTKDYPVPFRVNIPPTEVRKQYNVKMQFIAHYGGGEGIGFATGKIIRLVIDVPEGTLEPAPPDEEEIDLTETYKKVSEQIEEEEKPEEPADKITGQASIAVLDKESASKTWLYMIGLLVVLGLFIVGKVMAGRKRERDLGL